MTINLELDPIDSVVLQLYLLSFNTKSGKAFNKTDLIYLAYLFLYGYKEGKQMALKNELTLNKQSWANKMMSFRKLGIVTQDNQLHSSIKISRSDFNYDLNIKVNASN